MNTRNPKDFPENGFVIVGSRHERFYKAAIDCAESVKLFYPDAHITVYTDNEDWIKPVAGSVGDYSLTLACQAEL